MKIEDVKKNLNRRVSKNGLQCYELIGCILKRHRRTGKFYYLAELADLTCNKATVYCELKDIDSLEESE